MAPIATTPVSTSSTTTATITKPAKPLLRRTTLSGTVRTRDEAGLDLDDPGMALPSSPTKRARTVTFNPTVQEQIFSSSPTPIQLEKEYEVARTQTRNAILEHVVKAGSEAYDDIKAVFKQGNSSSAERRDGERSENEDMRLHLLALTSCVSLLGKDCNSLIRSVMNCEWVGRDEAFIKIYIQFLGNLASAQGSYVRDILHSIVDKFTGSKFPGSRLV